MTCVIACSKLWRPDIASRVEAQTGEPCVLLTDPDRLSEERLAQINPRFVFFPHWSHLIPEPIFSRWECVIFHMTDLPFGRGGSPLQNLIAKGIYETKISALKCVASLDAGPVYLKHPLSLHGTAQEIFLRATDAIEGLMVRMLREFPAPQEQSGEVTVFKRRTRQDGDISDLDSLASIHDWIRMLDADGYPSAYLELGEWCFEFTRSSYRGDHVLADVRIGRRKNGP
jgi:methionyl-tRNA formyltransferase